MMKLYLASSVCEIRLVFIFKMILKVFAYTYCSWITGSKFNVLIFIFIYRYSNSFSLLFAILIFECLILFFVFMDPCY